MNELVAYYAWCAALVDKGRATDIICLELCKTFDSVVHNRLVCQLESCRFEEWTSRWRRSWVDGRTQRVAFNSSVS